MNKSSGLSIVCAQNEILRGVSSVSRPILACVRNGELRFPTHRISVHEQHQSMVHRTHFKPLPRICDERDKIHRAPARIRRQCDHLIKLRLGRAVEYTQRMQHCQASHFIHGNQGNMRVQTWTHKRSSMNTNAARQRHRNVLLRKPAAAAQSRVRIASAADCVRRRCAPIADVCWPAQRHRLHCRYLPLTDGCGQSLRAAEPASHGPATARRHGRPRGRRGRTPDAHTTHPDEPQELI